MTEQLRNIPTNLIMGFLGVGKTTAILDLLKQKPENENWAVLVNEFGKIGIDGAIFSAAGATVKEIAGGCLCCALSVPFQVTINRLLKDVRPDRLLIEPTGLGHPKKVLDMLVSGPFQEALDVRASICLVDPEKLKDQRYTSHENFIDQIALSDVLVANKMDRADSVAIQLFHQWAASSHPEKALIAQTTQGQLDIAWLDLNRSANRKAAFPDRHKDIQFAPVGHLHGQLNNNADGYQSFGYVFPEGSCFDYAQLNALLGQLKAERIKGIFCTNQGWFIINSAEGVMNKFAISSALSSRVEIIMQKNEAQDIAESLNQCLLG